ncbi:response regulator [Solemya pervernicosa gill symbiont]|uniref:Response regulator n=2 Tax=Gammaproteobacteria incertae sedis TaxID=118884 RepID=A0A1T2L060_9GAMM|nr:sigma-54 dependent transcriptional regulator [Candidatus Reidiella endopervernicosa]OOZ38489.1 response regulator [Solemya pervernicosa gill symbiont]QKQ26558.1 sigma-54-dependent Fis family transcriptional regulator [Candidatus Reidiella endopervernicosa]
MYQILVIEDEVLIRQSLNRLLERHDYKVSDASSIDEATANNTLNDFDLIISDLRLPGAPGTDVLGMVENVPVVIMTSYASVRSAVEAMKLGAVDYIAKPFDHDELLLTIERVLKQRTLKRQNAALKSDLSHCYPVGGMIGSCEAMQGVFERIKRVSPTDTTVLVLGESGTGKELVARAVHENSTRSEAPIITVNCAAIPENLIESELFGHEKGAFTGATDTHHGLVEAANGGTLFLDEIGELPMEAQARLLRVLQEGEIRRVGATQSRNVDVRLIAATHRDLQQQVDDGNFRSDLYFRLHVMEIELPALRERSSDINELATRLLEKSCQRLNRPQMQMTSDALDAMNGYQWPGNVREMENAIERAVILADGEEINAEALGLGNSGTQKPQTTKADDLSLDDYFIQFVQSHEGKMTETDLSKQLGISRKTLWERRQRLGIPKQR